MGRTDRAQREHGVTIVQRVAQRRRLRRAGTRKKVEWKLARCAGALGKRGMEKVKESNKIESRRGSCGTIEELWKRKREEQVEGGKEEEKVFRSSKKTVRSPDVEREWEEWKSC